MAAIDTKSSSLYSSRRSSISRKDKSKNSMRSDSILHTPDVLTAPAHTIAPATCSRPEKKTQVFVNEYVLDVDLLIHKLELYQVQLMEIQLRHLEGKSSTRNTTAANSVAPETVDAIVMDQFSAKDTEPKCAGPMDSDLDATAGGIFGATASRPVQPQFRRVRRPQPLHLFPQQHVPAQEVQSALSPSRRAFGDDVQVVNEKQNRRRMTVSAIKGSRSTITLVTSRGLKEEFDFLVPPIRELTSVASDPTSPAGLSPVTPGLLERQPNGRPNARTDTDLESAKILHVLPERGAEDDVLYSEVTDGPAPASIIPRVPSPIVHISGEDPLLNQENILNWKKSFFDMFHRNKEVNDLLDMYMTEEQLSDIKTSKRKSSRSFRTEISRIWSTTNHRAPLPLTRDNRPD